MYRSYLLAILLLSSVFRPASASPVDSLQRALPKAATLSEQIRIYRDLADATAETPESRHYLIQLIKLAKADKQIKQVMEALTDLTIAHIQLNQADSAHYYAAWAEKQLPAEQCDQWCCYLRMRLFHNDMEGEGAEQAVDEKIEEFKTRSIASENNYQQIETEFCVAMALESKGTPKKAIIHLQKALERSEKLPFREGAQYQILILRQLARLHNYIQQTQEASDFTKNAIAIREKYYTRYEKKTRPYLSLNGFYISNYASLLINIENMPDKEIQYYLDQLVKLSDQSNRPADKYNRFHAQFNYSVIKREIPQALAYNDSLIYYARQIAPYNLPGLYKISASIFEIMGKDKEALENLSISQELQDSIRQTEMWSQVDQMRIEYDVNQLNHEKSQLQIRNKQIQLVTLLIALLVVGVLCIQLYRHLKRERRRKKHIQQLRLRAEESEKLKTIFIGSICQEIRMPLNEITASTNRLLDTTLPEEERRKQPEEIIHNTTILLALVDSMLEVSSLNVSEEKLPCKPVDVAELCRKAFREKALAGKGPIVSIAQLPNQPLVIPTNDRYLSLVIENLLSNAYKFTKQGSVTLGCQRSNMSVLISVTDTGCGIPADKHEEVFKRFTKLNPSMQGNGLALYLSKLIIEKLSGSIRIDPDYTKGTRIVVSLPIAQP